MIANSTNCESGESVAEDKKVATPKGVQDISPFEEKNPKRNGKRNGEQQVKPILLVASSVYPT